MLLVASTVVVGLMAGFFYAYACSVMVGLDRVDDRTFIVTMQWINATVRNAAFAPAFFGSLVLTMAAAVVALVLARPTRGWIVAAAVLYAAAFLVTLTLNVPLNFQLAEAGPADQISDLAAVRAALKALDSVEPTANRANSWVPDRAVDRAARDDQSGTRRAIAFFRPRPTTK